MAIVEDLKNQTSIYFREFSLVKNSRLPVIFYEATQQAQPYIPADGSNLLFDASSTTPTVRTSTPMSRPEPLYNNRKGEWSFALVIRGNNSLASFTTTQVCIDEVAGISTSSSSVFATDSGLGVPIWQTTIIGQKSTVVYPQDAVIDFDILDIARKIKQGKIPIFVAKSMGRVGIEYELYDDEAEDLPRHIYVQYETMLCSYLGDYGAGKTVNTFSLLPGEKTTISVRTYRDSVRSNSLSENILDSMSEASSNNLQESIESQKGNTTDNSIGIANSNSNTSNSHWNAGGGGGLNLGFFSIGGGGGGGASSASTSMNNFNAAFHANTISSIVNSALSQHVSESNKHREININTTTNSTESTGEENSVIRELSNVNLSRTLNFVFRQLHQTHIVIHWLKNIKFVYWNPNTGERRVVFSHNLLSMLEEVLIDSTAVDDVFAQIMTAVGYVFNYDEDPIQFFESRSFNTPSNNTNCDSRTLNANEDCLWLRVKDLSETYENITVNGVILGVQKHILRTPAVIVDSLLGQGEALDCYNMHLQEKDIDAKSEQIIEAQLRNELMTDNIAALNAISDPVQRADAYKKMFIEPKCCCEDANG
jgi:hypothetical protein